MTFLTALRNAAKHTEGESPTMPEIKKEERVEYLREAYITDTITEKQYEKFLDSAFDGGPPFYSKWFKRQPVTRHKRYAEKQVYIYCGDEYVIDGDAAVLADLDEEDRVVSVRGRPTPDDEHIEIVEDESEVSDEVKEKQEEIRDEILGHSAEGNTIHKS